MFRQGSVMADSVYGLTADSISSCMRGRIRGYVVAGLIYVMVFLDIISAFGQYIYPILKSGICHQWAAPRGGLGGLVPPFTSRQDQFSNSSKFDEKILVLE